MNGRSIVISAPPEGRLFPYTSPLSPVTIRLTMARPRPVPPSLVVKKGVKMCRSAFWLKPSPVSRMVILTELPLEPKTGRPLTTSVQTCRKPPLGMASLAFTNRFHKTCFICSGSDYINMYCIQIILR